MLDQYADKIKGIFWSDDPLTSEYSRPSALSQLNVLYKDFKTYFLNITESIKSHIEDSASELGRPKCKGHGATMSLQKDVGLWGRLLNSEKKIIHSSQLKQHNFSDWRIVLITGRNTFGFHVMPNFKFSWYFFRFSQVNIIKWVLIWQDWN